MRSTRTSSRATPRSPLLIRNPGGLVIEVTDGDAEFNADYRGTFFYDLAKVTPHRIALALAAELGDRATAVSLSPGWIRSEAMLDNFGVTEENWREGTAKNPHFCISETPHYVARCAVALAADPDRARFTGQSFASWDLGPIYGVTDLDGTQPHFPGSTPRGNGSRQARRRHRIPVTRSRLRAKMATTCVVYKRGFPVTPYREWKRRQERTDRCSTPQAQWRSSSAASVEPGRGMAVGLRPPARPSYVSGRTTRGGRSPMNRPETIEETDTWGGRPVHRLGSHAYGLTDVNGSQPDFWLYLHAFLAGRGQTFRVGRAAGPS